MHAPSTRGISTREAGECRGKQVDDTAETESWRNALTSDYVSGGGCLKLRAAPTRTAGADVATTAPRGVP